MVSKNSIYSYFMSQVWRQLHSKQLTVYLNDLGELSVGGVTHQLETLYSKYSPKESLEELIVQVDLEKTAQGLSSLKRALYAAQMPLQRIGNDARKPAKHARAALIALGVQGYLERTELIMLSASEAKVLVGENFKRSTFYDTMTMLENHGLVETAKQGHRASSSFYFLRVPEADSVPENMISWQDEALSWMEHQTSQIYGREEDKSAVKRIMDHRIERQKRLEAQNAAG